MKETCAYKNSYNMQINKTKRENYFKGLGLEGLLC